MNKLKDPRLIISTILLVMIVGVLIFSNTYIEYTVVEVDSHAIPYTMIHQVNIPNLLLIVGGTVCIALKYLKD